MKAAFHTGLKEIVIKDVSIPEIGDNDYLVQIKACSICGSDTWWNHDAVPNERVHGHEAAGIIMVAGKNTQKYKVGDRVVCYAILGCGTCCYCKTGMTSSCKEMKFIEHGFQEYGAYPEALLLPCPETFDWVTASLLSDAIGVPLHGLYRLPPQVNDNVEVWGLGPLGLLQIMFLKALGVQNIIGFDTVPERMNKAMELGASYAMNPTDPGTADKVMEITGGFGADKSYTYIRNAKVTEQIFSLTRKEGFICTFTGLDGQYCMPEYFERTLVWSFYFNPKEYENNIRFLVKHNIDLKQIISHTYHIDDIQEAFKMRFENPAESNKIVITMDTDSHG